MSGEQLHERGREGARRAKAWLDATTRADVRWVNPDPVAVPKLTFAWADDGEFSFDIGGLLLGGTKNSEEFLGEVKYYKAASDQSTLYDEYLAKCYRARKMMPSRCDNFFWITWSPFRASTWQDQCTREQIEKALDKHRAKALGLDDEAEARTAIAADQAFLDDLAGRLWLLVLSEKQEEHLVLSPEHLGVIRKYVTERVGS
jgi:hypothetical protein